MGTKTCISCNKPKPLNEFVKRKTSKSGFGNSCKECNNAYMRDYKKNNKDKISKINKKYRKNNLDTVKESNRKYLKKKYNENLEFRALVNLRNRIYKAIKRKSASTEKLLGAPIETIISFLNDNKYGYEYGDDNLDIDHIVPLSSAKTERELMELCRYTNLQLLPSYYNKHIKGDKKFNQTDFENYLEHGSMAL